MSTSLRPLLALSLAACGTAPPAPLPARVLSTAEASRFAGLALACIDREYPNKIHHVLASDDDVRPPRELFPAFHGCFDWHSSVHGHWLLARLARTMPEAPFAPEARAALQRSLRPERIAAEVAYLEAPGRESFERPYGLAWLLQLDAELREWDDEGPRQWAAALRPLAEEARDRLAAWLLKLTHPIRTGEHSQTAFAMGLMLDWARVAGDTEFSLLVARRAREFYLGDRGWSLRFEPGGQDFLSPGLAEADLMRRVLPPDEFAAWLGEFLPEMNDELEAVLAPAIVTDRADGKLAHLDGLNLSRAWMLEGIAHGLPAHDVRREAILRCAARHVEAGLAAVTGEHYAGGHWLGSFAVYLATRRGLA